MLSALATRIHLIQWLGVWYRLMIELPVHKSRAFAALLCLTRLRTDILSGVMSASNTFWHRDKWIAFTTQLLCRSSPCRYRITFFLTLSFSSFFFFKPSLSFSLLIIIPFISLSTDICSFTFHSLSLSLVFALTLTFSSLVPFSLLIWSRPSF